jgi:polysaccharide chain length determinant protein (PEP-CTERM system associated)
MIWKRKVLIVAVWLLVSAAAFAVVSRIPAIYSANVLIVVDSQKIPERYVSSTVSMDAGERLMAISQQILSSARLKQLIGEFGLYQHQRNTEVPEFVVMRMRPDIKIMVEPGSTGRLNGFRVAYEGEDRSVVAQVANRLANFFIEENLKSRETQAKGTSEFIQTQLQDAKQRLDELEAAVSRYKVQHTGELPQQEAALLGSLDRLRAELQANSENINRAQEAKLVSENLAHMAETTLATLIKSAATPAAAPKRAAESPQQDPPRNSAAIQAQLEKLRLRYSDQHPDVKRLKDMLDEALQVEGRAAQAPPKRTTEEPDATAVIAAAPPAANEAAEIAKARERVSVLKTQIQAKIKEREALEADQQRIRRDMMSVQSRIDRLPFREQEMAQIMRDYDTSKANYQALLGKKLAAEMATDLERGQKSERFTIMDPAQTPFAPVRPNRRLYNLFGTAFGLALGLAVGLALELKRNMILGEWELPPNAVVLARLPRISQDAGAAASEPGARRKPRLRLFVITSVLLCVIGLVFGASFAWSRF